MAIICEDFIDEPPVGLKTVKSARRGRATPMVLKLKSMQL